MEVPVAGFLEALALGHQAVVADEHEVHAGVFAQLHGLHELLDDAR